MKSTAVLTCLFVVAAAAGCGGGEKSKTTPESARLLSLDPVVECLRRTVRHGQVTTAQSDLDQIARRAGRGAARVRFGVSRKIPKGLNVATVVLERSEGDAKTTESRYRSVYRALGGSPAGVLLRSGNAVVAFGARPLPQERLAVSRCVRP
jgi:hypothetical protein